MGVGYAYRILSNNEHVHNLGVCQINVSSSVMQAVCPGQGCYALTRLFSRFHKGRHLSCSPDGAFKVKGSLL